MKAEEKKTEEKKLGKWLVFGSGIVVTVTLIITAIVIFWTEGKSKLESRKNTEKEFSTPARVAETVRVEPIQIYPNYEFSEGVNQIKVPLIPSHHALPREAGGWVIIPLGSEFRVDDFKVAVVIEYNNGKKFRREPTGRGKTPLWDEVEADNGIFRLYGQEGEYATVAIKRGIY